MKNSKSKTSSEG